MSSFNICPSCMHQNSCVLTAQKDKVWSCSDYDEVKSETLVKKKCNSNQAKVNFSLSI